MAYRQCFKACGGQNMTKDGSGKRDIEEMKRKHHSDRKKSMASQVTSFEGGTVKKAKGIRGATQTNTDVNI